MTYSYNEKYSLFVWNFHLSESSVFYLVSLFVKALIFVSSVFLLVNQPVLIHVVGCSLSLTVKYYNNVSIVKYYNNMDKNWLVNKEKYRRYKD